MRAGVWSIIRSSCNKEGARHTNIRCLETYLCVSFRVCYGARRMSLLIMAGARFTLARASLMGSELLMLHFRIHEAFVGFLLCGKKYGNF